VREGPRARSVILPSAAVFRRNQLVAAVSLQSSCQLVGWVVKEENEVRDEKLKDGSGWTGHETLLGGSRTRLGVDVRVSLLALFQGVGARCPNS